MPSVDELLNAAEITEATLTETNDKIEIDADTRTMMIPDTERIFGVMSDEKGERKYFRCKRFVGNGIDLSKLSLRIVFQNASGLDTGRDKYIVTDLATDGEDYITFSWELSRKVTAYKGIISFIVCAIKTKSDGTITNEWNTTLANGIVLEGLEANGTQEQEEVARDYYNQLEAELLKVANEQKTELEKKAQEVIKTIPSDYTQMQKDVNKLNEDIDNKIEHVGGYKEYDIGTPSVGTYWNKSAKKQLESEMYQSFNPISLKAGTYHYENMSGYFTFYEDTDGNWIPIGKYTASGNGDVEIPNDTTMYITEMQKSGVFAGAKLSSGDITQKESNWFKNPKYDIDNIINTLKSLSDSVNDIKSIDGSAIKEYCIYVSTTGSDTSGDGSEEKPFATIYHANETITDNSYTKRYRIIVLPGTYTDLQDKYTGVTPTGKYQGVITKPWVTYESKSGNPKDTIIEWDGSTGLENPTRDDVVEKCAFHIVSLPRTFTAIKGFTIKSKNTRYAMHCESSSRGIQGEWLIENCIFDWGGCPDISDDTGRFPAIGIGMSPCEKGTIKFCKIVTTTVETMLVHDGKNNNGNSAVILGAELNFIKCDLGTGRLQFQSIYPKSGEINAKTNNICNLVSCTQINSLYSYISSLNSDGEMVWRVYEKDCDFASYGNMSDYVYKIGTANNVSN